MKKKLRLNFDQLEKEMGLQNNILISPVDLSSISGGSTIEDYLDYFRSLGFTFTQDANGNYYSGSSMWLDPVTVTATIHKNNSNYTTPAWEFTQFWTNWDNTYGYAGGGASASATNATANGVNWNGFQFGYNSASVCQTALVSNRDLQYVTNNYSSDLQNLHTAIKTGSEWNGLVFDISSTLKNSPKLIEGLGKGCGVASALLSLPDTWDSAQRALNGTATLDDWENLAVGALSIGAIFVTGPVGVGIGVSATIGDFIWDNWVSEEN